MADPSSFLAFDLGASSGRAMLGRLADGRLTLAEAHRFANGPIDAPGPMRWNLGRLEREIARGLEVARSRAGRLAAVGVDTWGVDYVLLGRGGQAVEQPYHYRDHRTEGVCDRVCARVGRERIFGCTGIQFMPFNTIFQLAAHDPDVLARAERMLLMADYLATRLGGRPVGEVTLASTTQLLDPRTRRWADSLIAELGLPRAIFPPLVEAGTVVGDCGGSAVVATAHHDTGAAVAGTPGAGDDWAFLSSGTWSILGLELREPVLTPEALAANVSNELGVNGTVRLLKNIAGLWPLQECRRHWAAAGDDRGWDELVALAEAAPPLAGVIDPDDARFLAPDDMPAAIAAACRDGGQPPPSSIGATVRLILESLALKTRYTLELLQRVTGKPIRTIHLIGGGVRNRLLCQWTADATGCRVLAGPVEATATGNLLAQAVGVGAIAGWADARAIVRASFELADYDPRPSRAWQDAYGRLCDLI
ncbi:MAG: Rhamnulokinase [Phycisphaerae bacterium]|nr:Rhamnulokinase [Phycisphaerae bacterium]